MNKATIIIGTATAAAIILTVPQIVRANPSIVAKEITVLIEGPVHGSGTIIAKNGNTYFVLTAAHVVKDTNPGEETHITTHDGQLHAVNTYRMRKLPGVDLALIEFTSNRNYPITTIGDSNKVPALATVYVGGFPHPGRETEQDFFITEGKIASINSNHPEGYNFIYTNITKIGMSGGPVLNERGHLIGIHGRAEGTRLGDGTPIKDGFNLGIPIQIFFNKTGSAGINLNLRLASSSPPPTITPVTPPSPPQQNLISYAKPKIFLERNFKGHYSGVNSVAISPDGGTIVSGSWDKTIKVWDLATGRLKATLTGHYSGVRSVAISPDGGTIVSGSQDKTIKVWDLATGRLKANLKRHSYSVNSVAISPDGGTIVSGGRGNTIKVWRAIP